MPRNDVECRIVDVLVEDGEDLPHHSCWFPGVVTTVRSRVRTRRCTDGIHDGFAQGGRRREVDVRGDPVGAARIGTQRGREVLGQPSFDAARRHRDDLGCHRIGKRGPQDVGECVGEGVAAFCAVEAQHVVFRPRSVRVHRLRLDAMRFLSLIHISEPTRPY